MVTWSILLSLHIALALKEPACMSKNGNYTRCPGEGRRSAHMVAAVTVALHALRTPVQPAPLQAAWLGQSPPLS